jgi:hypothetical protein
MHACISITTPKAIVLALMDSTPRFCDAAASSTDRNYHHACRAIFPYHFYNTFIQNVTGKRGSSVSAKTDANFVSFFAVICGIALTSAPAGALSEQSEETLDFVLSVMF